MVVPNGCHCNSTGSIPARGRGTPHPGLPPKICKILPWYTHYPHDKWIHKCCSSPTCERSRRDSREFTRDRGKGRGTAGGRRGREGREGRGNETTAAVADEGRCGGRSFAYGGRAPGGGPSRTCPRPPVDGGRGRLRLILHRRPAKVDQGPSPIALTARTR